jgi:hypothetical protein
MAMAQMRLGNQDEAQRLFAEAVGSIERYYADHSQLRDLCAEAKSVLHAIPEPSADMS